MFRQMWSKAVRTGKSPIGRSGTGTKDGRLTEVLHKRPA